MKMWIDFAYILSAIFFVLGIKLLGRASHARFGNLVSASGMALAVLVTILSRGVANWHWILIAGLAGVLIGTFSALRVKLTSMPEMVALLNGFGGIASLFVGWAEGRFLFAGAQIESLVFAKLAVVSAIWIGGVTFSGSLIAYGKLSQILPGSPVQFYGQRILLGILLVFSLLLAFFCISDGNTCLPLIVLVSSVLGLLLVLPIGGGDMPVVISLLNSLSGLAACAAGLIILNKVLIVAGCLVGTSGLILTVVMCKAMNRSLANVLFSGFGGSTAKKSVVGAEVEPKSMSAQDAYYVFESARSVAFIPGYGMAVAQAQHAIKDLTKVLEDNGAEVFFAIHPVAGRMPGHMNVLLAEADVPYEQLLELEMANLKLENVDVAVVVGANDVVNPAAKEDETSPIYGMPIVEVSKAKNVFVLKRGKGLGFSGLVNGLFVKENTRMIYGDAKSTLTSLIGEFKEN